MVDGPIGALAFNFDELSETMALSEPIVRGDLCDRLAMVVKTFALVMFWTVAVLECPPDAMLSIWLRLGLLCIVRVRSDVGVPAAKKIATKVGPRNLKKYE